MDTSAAACSVCREAFTNYTDDHASRDDWFSNERPASAEELSAADSVFRTAAGDAAELVDSSGMATHDSRHVWGLDALDSTMDEWIGPLHPAGIRQNASCAEVDALLGDSDILDDIFARV